MFPQLRQKLTNLAIEKTIEDRENALAFLTAELDETQ